jgi:hypothetical protein
MSYAHARRRTASIATILVACALVVLAVMASAAQATPTEVNVRIEGRTQTLFEGPILTEGHDVSSYKGQSGEEAEDIAEHSCDGINVLDPGNTEPGPVPTAASVDAMNTIGETKAMAGQWYNGFNDYFVKQWGVEEENAESEGRSWGILVNNVFTNVGGCQYQLDTGDEVLWTYNAFEARPFLALFATGADYAGGDRPLTATAQLGKPFLLEVLSYEDDTEDIPPAHPERTGASSFAGAEVAPVATSNKGLQKLDLESPEAVSTDSAGKASITFTTPGWHRLKAGGPIEAETGEEEVIRSNRLDVCVPAEGASGCGDPPAEDRLRVPPRYQSQIGTAPKNWNAPDVYGPTLAGQTLTATEGDWTGKATIAYSYRWQLCDNTGGGCEDIPGASGSSYELPSSAAGHTLRVIVKAKNGVGSTEAESARTNEVPISPSNTEAPSIEGTAEEGHTLTASSGKWSGSAPIGFEYAWLRCNGSGGECAQVSGLSPSPTYVATPADVGATLRAKVIAKNAAGTATVESTATATVKAAPVIVVSPPPGGGGSSTGQAPTGQTPGGQVLGQTAAQPPAIVTVARLAAQQLVLKVSAAGTVTVKITARKRHAGKLIWSTLKTIKIKASKAGTITVRLPHLSPGSYRLSIALASSKPLLRALTVKRR